MKQSQSRGLLKSSFIFTRKLCVKVVQGEGDPGTGGPGDRSPEDRDGGPGEVLLPTETEGDEMVLSCAIFQNGWSCVYKIVYLCNISKWVELCI